MMTVSNGPPPPAGRISEQLKMMPLKDYTTDHINSKIEISEVHNLSPFAKSVHPTIVLKLVKEWENGLTLIVILDDECWELLAKMDFPLGLASVYEVAEYMRLGE